MKADKIKWICAGMLYLVLIGSPLFQGLFMEYEILPGLLIMAVIFMLCLGEQLKLGDQEHFVLMDYCVLALCFAYMISLWQAVQMHAALLEFMKIVAYFMAYWIARRLARVETTFRGLLLSVYIAALILAVIGMGAALGWIDFPGAYGDGHIRSALQYHNTLAIYLASATLIGWALSLTDSHPVKPVFWLCGNYFLLVVLVGTLSRGTLILYPLAVAAFFLFISARDRGRAFSHLMLFLPPACFTAAFVYSILHSNQPGLSFVILVGGLAAVALASWFYAAYLAVHLKNANPRLKITYGLIAAAVSLLLITAGGWYMSHSARYSPSQAASPNLTEKFQRLSVGEHSVQERLTSYEDALKIIKDYPLTGAGGGAWPLLYHHYASRLYWCNEMHSFYIKTLLEAGILGLMALLALCFAFLLILHKIWREAEDKDRPLLAAAALTIVLVGLHSAFDFDLSLPAVAFMLFAVLGALQGQVLSWVGGKKSLNNHKSAGPNPRDRGRPISSMVVLAMGLVFAAGLTASSALFYSAQRIGNEGDRALQKAQPGAAERAFTRAARLDPSQADYPLKLALINAGYFKENRDRIYYSQALSYAELAKSLDPYNSKTNILLFRIYGLLKRPDLQLKTCQAAIWANPFIGQSYETLTDTTMGMVWTLLDDYKLERAKPYLAIVLKNRKGMPAGVEGPVSRTNLAAGQSALFLGEFARAREYLEASRSNPACAKVARRWLPAAAWLEARKHNQPDKRVTQDDLAPLMAFLQSEPD